MTTIFPIILLVWLCLAAALPLLEVLADMCLSQTMSGLDVFQKMWSFGIRSFMVFGTVLWIILA